MKFAAVLLSSTFLNKPFKSVEFEEGSFVLLYGQRVQQLKYYHFYERTNITAGCSPARGLSVSTVQSTGMHIVSTGMSCMGTGSTVITVQNWR